MANMDWAQSAPTGYVPAFRSGNANQFGHSHDANNSYMLRGEASIHDLRTQYGPTAEYNSHNAHVAPALHTGLRVPGSGIEDHFWSQQNDTSRDQILPNGPPDTRDEPIEDDADADVDAEDTLDIDEEPAATGSARPRRPVIPRSERRKNYKPRPPVSHPRLFRPFVPLENEDTTPTLWTMPPIVGSYLMFSNKLIKYRPMPPDIDLVRDKLFKMEVPILLKNSQEVADYVPHITNVWRRAIQKAEVDPETGVQTEYWHCRTKKAMRTRNVSYPTKGVRQRERKSQTLFHDQDICKMRVRVTSFTKHADVNPFPIRIYGPSNTNGHATHRKVGTAERHERWGGGPCKCVAEWVHFELINKDPELREHTHDLEVFDKYKRSEALQVLAKNKCEEGNSFSATAKWMHKTFGEISKQVSKFEKGDTANAAQMWRKGTRDYVLREVVPEDSEEMTTMRKCVDAIVEADAPSLRAALREVLKDSDELTKTALAILEKHKPAIATPEPEEPWKLTEGVSVMNLPPPGAPRRLKNNPGVHQEPARTPDPPLPSDSNTSSNRQEGQQLGPPTMLYPPFIGPDGRPIPSPAVPAPATTAPSQASARAAQPQQNMHPQPPGPATANMQQPRGAALQPRPAMPTYSGPSPVEVRYVNPPPQQGAIHPITVSLEVPSCQLGNCRQCNHMRRDLAGRTFFFQDTLITHTHFTKLQELLRDPKQLLHDSYTSQLQQSQVPLWHRHPALGTAPAFRPGAYNPQAVHRAAHVPGPNGNQQIQWVPLPGHNLPPPPPPPKPRAKAPRKSAKAQTTDGASGPASTQPQSGSASIYDRPLPVPIVIEDHDDAAAGGVEVDAAGQANVGETNGGANADKVGSEKGSGDGNAAVDKDGDEDTNDEIAEGINAVMNANNDPTEAVSAKVNANVTQEVEVGKNNTVEANNENEEEDDDGEEEEEEDDEDEDDDQDEQRPAKRRRQESAEES